MKRRHCKMDLPFCWLLGLLCPLYVCAYRNGKVESACGTMMPNHGVPAQTSPAPYNISVNHTVYKAGDKISVTLHSYDLPFEGVLLQVRSVSDVNTPIGTFHVNDSNLQTLNCTTKNSAVSHTSDATKIEVKVIWEAPSKSVGDIKMRATVVANQTIFWLNVTGPKITHDSSVASVIKAPALVSQVICHLLMMAVIKIGSVEM